jgi:hypothetical protein
MFLTFYQYCQKHSVGTDLIGLSPEGVSLLLAMLEAGAFLW